MQMCAAPARTLEPAARRHSTPEKVAVFTDVQATIRRMALGRTGSARSRLNRENINAGHHHRFPARSPRERRRPARGPNSPRSSRTPVVWMVMAMIR